MKLKAYNLLAAIIFLMAFVSCVHADVQSRVPNDVNDRNSSVVATSNWHGFNLLNMFWKNWKDEPFQEKDFQLVADLGFNFVRLPLDYRILTEEKNWLITKEDRLLQLDNAVKWGLKYKIHVCLNLHRAPGYVVSDKEPETVNLWIDKNAQSAFLNLWQIIAKRYKEIPVSALSFNLLNEPANIDSAALENVIRPVIKAIREISPNRTIIIDGLEWGKKPIPNLSDINVIQATRGYSPNKLLSWNPQSGELPPKWPTDEFNEKWLIDNEIGPWQGMIQKNVSIFVGEFGARNIIPHSFVLAWMEDQLKIWQELDWGWALWNLYGEHGIFDSERKDVIYEDFQGHKLDRKMLTLLQKYK